MTAGPLGDDVFLRRSLRPIRALIFDLDGTLVDSYGAIAAALNAVLDEHGIPARSLDEVRGAVGHGLDDLLGRYLPKRDVPSGEIRFREEYRKVFLEQTFLLPGVLRTLSSLHESRFGLAVASNKPADFSREICDHLRLSPFLRTVRGPAADLPPKPHPAMLSACVADLGATATTCIYVGDMALDVESASRAGLPVVLVPTGSTPLDALKATGMPVLTTLDDLLGLLDL